MNKQIWIALTAILISGIGFASGGGTSVHWDYKGKNSPYHWGDMKSEFATCKDGKQQSPINIITTTVERQNLLPIQFNYQSSPLKIIDNGHTIQVNYEPGSYILIGNDRYELLQFHFHVPSEEQINGKNFDMVAHLVHKSAAGELAVLAVLFDKGASHPALDKIWQAIPENEGREMISSSKIRVQRLLPSDRRYYSFTGSLTTPPCSEGVRWLVLQQAVTLSVEQLYRFKDHYAFNARPVQPLNDRRVYSSR